MKFPDNVTATLTVVASVLSLSSTHSLAQSAPAGNPLDSLPTLPKTPAQVLVPLQLEPPQAPAQDVLARIVQVSRVDVLGSTAVPFEQVSALLTPLAGQQLTVAELAAVAQRVTELYQQHGYALCFAYLPPQEFAGGVVQINVVEGYIQTLEVSGNLGHSEGLVREIAEPLMAERPLTVATFQRQTQLMARLPGIEIAASANPPITTDGATPLIIRAKHKPITLSVGGEIRKPTPRFIAMATLNDPLWKGSQLQLSTLLKNVDRERFVSAGFTQVLTPNGTTARVNYSDYRSHNDPLTHQAGIDDVTHQRKLDIGITHPWLLSGTEQLTSSAGMYAVNYGKAYRIEATGLAIDDEEKLRAVYGQLNWFRTQPQMAQFASVLLAKGVNALGAGLHRGNSAGLPMAANPAKLDFTRVSIDYTQRHRFDNRMGTAFAVGGQYSPDVLPAPERISFGGTRFGRGYAAGEFAGDSGLGASVELNYQFVTDMPWIKSIEPYALYEHARTSQQLQGLRSATLRSVSLGLRLADNKYYALDIGASKPQGDQSIHNPERKLRYGLLLTYNLDI